jgi:YVTN family beta-propeller protein
VLAADRVLLALLTLAALLAAQDRRAPAGSRPANRQPVTSILPGGRILAPAGARYPTGLGAFGLAVSPSGKAFAAANGGPGENSITIVESDKSGRWQARQWNARNPDDPGTLEADWRGVSTGLAFAGERSIFVSEGSSGRISVLDLGADRRRTIELNRSGFQNSYSGDLAFDASAGLLYAADQANLRVVVIETRSRQAIASVPLGRMPSTLALSPDRRKLYVASARESNSLCVVDVSDPSAPKVEALIPTGPPMGPESGGGSSPSGVVATADRVFVSNAADDSITVIDAHTNRVEAEIPIRIPGLERLRGVQPLGMAYLQDAGRLLVAEAGIDAVGVIDVQGRRVLGHIPVGWFPTRVAFAGGQILVANAWGSGWGPTDPDHARPAHGSISAFPPPGDAELAADTAFVMESNGFRERASAPPPLPTGIRRVVLIVKENRTYDEVLGDIPEASNGPAMWAPELARLGTRGFVDGRRQRLSIKDVNITPNHHAIAGQWTFSDNFYADSEIGLDGRHWLAGAIWSHFARNAIPFLNFGEGLEPAGVDEDKDLGPTGARLLANPPMPEPLYSNTSRQYPGFDMSIPDQDRASQFIREIDQRFVKTGAELPRFLLIQLPNDHTASARPAEGYPYEESFVADNDLALGRILEYLSSTKWWKEMAVFITEDGPLAGVDHIDARRTVLLSAGPWFKRNYVSHTNASFAGLLKTIFRLLGLPPLNLFDASAADLSDCFARRPDLAPYRAKEVDKRVFDPAEAKKGNRGEPALKTDDPQDLRRQHK